MTDKPKTPEEEADSARDLVSRINDPNITFNEKTKRIDMVVDYTEEVRNAREAVKKNEGQ